MTTELSLVFKLSQYQHHAEAPDLSSQLQLKRLSKRSSLNTGWPPVPAVPAFWLIPGRAVVEQKVYG